MPHKTGKTHDGRDVYETENGQPFVYRDDGSAKFLSKDESKWGTEGGSNPGGDGVPPLVVGQQSAHFGQQEPGDSPTPGAYTGTVKYPPDGEIVKSPAGEPTPDDPEPEPEDDADDGGDEPSDGDGEGTGGGA